jgi:hypothetical protein
MFEEIPTRPAPPTQKTARRAFAISFASFLIASVFAWFRWAGHPLSLTREMATAEFILGSMLSGVFLLTAKSAAPEDNRKRLWVLFWALMTFQLLIDVLQ